MVTKSSHTSLFPQCKSRAILQQVRAYHQDNETREENLGLRNSVRQDIDGIEKELAEHRRALHQHKFILNIFVVSFGFVLGISGYFVFWDDILETRETTAVSMNEGSDA